MIPRRLAQTRMALVVLAFFSPHAFPQDTGNYVDFDEVPVFGLPLNPAPKVILERSEIEVINLSKESQKKFEPPLIGKNGKIIYHFGESTPAIVCSPGNVTDIQLQRGEQIEANGVIVGDSVNWSVVPIAQGAGSRHIPHLIVKPVYPNLRTTMIVVTNLRTYYFHLKSSDNREEFMSSVAFSYPEIPAEYWAQYIATANVNVVKAQAEAAVKVPTAGPGETTRPITDLDFNYEVSGAKTAWYPVRIYNDAQKTYIQMSDQVAFDEIPVFLELTASGEESVVNYRLVGTTFVIDKVFAAGMLLAAQGRRQQAVTIRHNGGAGEGG